MKKIIKPTTLAETAFTVLRKAIIEQELEANRLYSATELGEWIGGISRTPIREAAQFLEKVGMVRIEKNKGIRILSTSLEMLVESFQIRLMLEVPIMRQAATIRSEQDVANIQRLYEAFEAAAQRNDVDATLEADRDYHLGLLTIVGNGKATSIIEDSRNSVLMTGASTIPHSRSCMDTFIDHVQLHQAVLQGDGQAAAVAMKQHIINTASLLITQESSKRPDWQGKDVIKQLSWINPE